MVPDGTRVLGEGEGSDDEGTLSRKLQVRFSGFPWVVGVSGTQTEGAPVSPDFDGRTVDRTLFDLPGRGRRRKES